MKKYGLKFSAAGWKEVKQTLKENRTLSLIWWISNQASSTGIIVAGFLLTTTEVGFYSAALRMIIIIQSIVSMPLNTVLFPYIGEAFGQGYDQGIRRVNKTFPYLVMVAFGMAAGTMILADPLILVFFGREFETAGLLLKVSAVALLFSTINAALGQQVMLNLRKDAMHIRFLVAGFVLNVVLLVLFIRLYGSLGAAIAWPAAELVIFAGYLFYFRTQGVKVFDYQYYKPGLIINELLGFIRDRSRKKKAALR